MKVYVHKRKIILIGKAQEVQKKLTQYNQYHHYVNDWIQHIKNNKV
ncbi:hypothetical protein J27TS8_06490 [Robertmurraya siralis]|uniref:Z-ring formation inhibitor MciZ n=1 Tax=Robertmurraya siralis TaxID=77777 RepID=A0A919WET9_9BACI|nr:Z-ring formation inhibitor MciZ [Robertmurraya siralis]PAE22068.1 Z-ring formation inhibitor MciZ [Bacillus sp. 7504-2]GIN60656.1 hypothetical protein J27TS8_06490 [Robertmurraya siralis]